MTEPLFLTAEEVEYLHQRGLDEHGGRPGLRDRGLLESALAMPQAGFGGEFFHSSIFHMAAAYAFHIAENQPFVDGNKRAAIAAALMFLALNGIELSVEANEPLYDAMMAISARKLDKAGLAGILERLAKAV
jgi:death-on-curing protein